MLQVGVDAAGVLGKFDVQRIALGAAFAQRRSAAFPGASPGWPTVIAMRTAAPSGGVDPRVVRDGKGQRQRRLGVEVVFEDAAVEGLRAGCWW